MDVDTGRVLWSLNPHRAVPIASMSKMMTLLVALETIEFHHIPLSRTVTVSNSAVQVTPTIAGLRPKDQLTLASLLQSTIVKSANDCAQMTAEFFGGGKAAPFIAAMNRKAKALGMSQAVFFNPHGLPAQQNNRASCEEMVRLGTALMQHPLAREWVSRQKITFTKKGAKSVLFYNHNRLLKSKQCPGVNGIKTGFTQRAGFCITANCERDNHHLMAVVTGCPSQRDRDSLVKKLFNWGFRRLDK